MATKSPRRYARLVSDTVDDLILDLLEWIGHGERPYRETMEAWRTSCPRLPVWEDATDRGFIERHRDPGQPAVVAVSAAGSRHLHEHRHAQGHPSKFPFGVPNVG